MQSNMLSAKKVKIHGMKSRRWTVNDKITQYKGLVNLYARDKKILQTDTNKDRKKLKNEIRKIRKEIDYQRETLDNAIQGDRQRLRNTLSDNRNLLLAYSSMHPTRVIEVLYQENFNKRKLLDRVIYAMKDRTKKLIDLKLEYAELEDRIRFEAKELIPEEEQAQILTSKVQDAIMKNETARDIQYTYKSILYVLQKDAIYFDAVLRALQIDGYNQGRCLIKITEMGQLATEYLDDKTDEYHNLEAALKASMIEREKGINDIKDKIQNLHNNVKYLIRRDSVINLDDDKKRSKSSYSELELIHEVENITYTLNRIKEIAIVAQIEDIFPQFEEQQKQRLRLQDLVAKTTKDRNTLLNKSKHAEEMYNNLSHSMVESTMWYKDEKVRLSEEIAVVQNQSADIIDLIKSRGELFIKVRSSLQQLAEILRNARADKVPPVTPKKKEAKAKKTQQHLEFEDSLVPPEKVEQGAMELLALITKKLTMLVKESKGLTESQQASTAFENLVIKMIDTTNVMDTAVKEESLIDDMLLEDSSVPSRFEIKAKSAEICEKNAKSEFDV